LEINLKYTSVYNLSSMPGRGGAGKSTFRYNDARQYTMPPINLRRIVLNLLTIFEATYEEGGQQKVAERLFLSQPAISAAISKFRYMV
jgi:Bacterial regulatory helix-turn-helix protein, lysR family